MEKTSAAQLKLVPAGPTLAARLQTHLRNAEAALDSTASLAGEMIAKTLEIAAVAGVHRVHIQKHLKELTASIDHALEGQMQLQRFHAGCRHFMKVVDMDALGFGDTATQDPDTPPLPSGKHQAATIVA